MGGLGRRLHHDLSDGIICNRIKMGKLWRLSTMDARGQRWINERLAGLEEVLMNFCYFVPEVIPKLVY